MSRGSQDACEVVAATAAAAPFVLTCEHASARLPEPWRWSAADHWIAQTHWAYDLGAEALTRELSAAAGAPAVLARFSRLLVDPNRPGDDPTAFRERAEGRLIELNQNLTAEDRARRLAYGSAYHLACERAVDDCPATVVLAIHSFTTEYEGQRRDDIELGVLFDDQESLGRRLAETLAPVSALVHLNRPYSGSQGMIYSADRHARRAGKRAVEIEVRQDLAVDEAFRRRLVEAIAGTPWWV
ncbi:MAG: N-formylglutamate amidohydrolase [Deltaproteobacteria bacterium]|nr:N-formylglutamate amidohydrolase [Deltaproteobacteria bacterium]